MNVLRLISCNFVFKPSAHMLRLLGALLLCVCVCTPSSALTSEKAWWQFWRATPIPDSLTPEQRSQTELEQAQFGELVYYYFQQDYQQVLQLVAVGEKAHGFTMLSDDNKDRLQLIKGASQLNTGLYQRAQQIFSRLLQQSSSDYVQANTWFFVAKASFTNKQSDVSEQAYSAISQGDLREQLSDEQWYELLYLTAYSRQQNGLDWQTLAAQIPQYNIYSAYLLANQAVVEYNENNFDVASNTFVSAKRALIEHKNKDGLLTKWGRGIFDSVAYVARPWRWFSESASAQRELDKQQKQQALDEQDALFDRINLGLTQTLLQSDDLHNAIEVIQTVAGDGVESEQALLTYAWAQANQNNWSDAMSAWQHLQQHGSSLIKLQANYGLAYAFSRQDQLGQAFYALSETANDIDDSIDQLDAFALQVKQADFFDDYQNKWPKQLADLRLSFFQPTQQFDAKYLLAMREQANGILDDIAHKQNRIAQLDNMLGERRQAYASRLDDLSLAPAAKTLQNAQQQVRELHAMLSETDSFEGQLAVGKLMADSKRKSELTRLANATKRHTRLANDTTRKRPLRASYKTRLDRINGILMWQIMDEYVADKWQHQKLLKQATDSLNVAVEKYQRLASLGDQDNAFASQSEQFSALNNALSQQHATAQQVYQTANQQLTNELLTLISTRREQLAEQGVNTRLDILRIQDLHPEGEGE